MTSSLPAGRPGWRLDLDLRSRDIERERRWAERQAAHDRDRQVSVDSLAVDDHVRGFPWTDFVVRGGR